MTSVDRRVGQGCYGRRPTFVFVAPSDGGPALARPRLDHSANACLSPCLPVSVVKTGLSILLALASLLTAQPAYAQRELRIRTLLETPLPFVTTCAAPIAGSITVNDAAKVVAIGQRLGVAGAMGNPEQLTFYKLTDQGQIAPGDPVRVKLPKPARLDPHPNYVLALTSHPTLPLVYVWQDVPPLPDPQVIDPALAVEFDHLLVFDVSVWPPTLAFACCRGAEHHVGDRRGGMAIDKTARRLFVPNMQMIGKPMNMTKTVPALGWLKLANDGLPYFVESDKAVAMAESTQPPMPPGPPLDPAGAAAARAPRIAQYEAAKATPKPLLPARYAEWTTYSFTVWPGPDSYCPVSDDAILLGSDSGAASWNLEDRLGRFGYFFIQPQAPYRYRLAAHPTLPAAYATCITYDGRIHRFEVADGYFTLAPQILSIDTAICHSPVTVMPANNQIAVGAVGKICVLSLTPEGKLTTQGVQMTVNNPTVEALAWSEKLGRLYVPVEK